MLTGLHPRRIIAFFLFFVLITMPPAFAGQGWKTLPTDEEIQSAAAGAVSGLQAVGWSTHKRHDGSSQPDPTPNKLWKNKVYLVWIEPNPNYIPCDASNPDCVPLGAPYWCGNTTLFYEGGWAFDPGEPLYEVESLDQCTGFLGDEPGWIGLQDQKNQAPTVTLAITSQTASRVELLAQASDPDGDALSYTWYIDGNKSGASNPDVFWNNPPKGTHTIRVVVSDGRGGTAEDSTIFTSGAQPKRYVIAPGFNEGEGSHQAYIKEVIVDGKEDPSAKNTLLYVGTRIKTGPGVEIVVEFSTGSILRLKANTELEVQEPKIKRASRKEVYTRLVNGILEFYWPPGHEGAAKFEIATERAVTSIKGTRLTISNLDGVTLVEVQEGEVEVKDVGTENVSTVSAGHSARFDGSAGAASIEAALDDNGNGVLDDAEIRQAVQYWVTGQPVLGTGQTISDAKIRELVQMWILGQRVSPAAATVLLPRGVHLSAPGPLEREVYVQAQWLRLELFDLSGRLLTWYEAAGPRLKFSLRLSDGSPLANGVYLYVVSAQQATGTWRSPVQKVVVFR